MIEWFALFAKLPRKGLSPHKRTVAHLAIKTDDLWNMFPLRAHRLSATTVVFHSVGATGLAANRLLMS